MVINQKKFKEDEEAAIRGNQSASTGDEIELTRDLRKKQSNNGTMNPKDIVELSPQHFKSKETCIWFSLLERYAENFMKEQEDNESMEFKQRSTNHSSNSQ